MVMKKKTCQSRRYVESETPYLRRLHSVSEQCPRMAADVAPHYGVLHFPQKGTGREHHQFTLVIFSRHIFCNLNATSAKKELQKNLYLDKLSKYGGKFYIFRNCFHYSSVFCSSHLALPKHHYSGINSPLSCF